MKKIILTIIFIISLMPPAFAGNTMLQQHFFGVNGEILKNIETRTKIYLQDQTALNTTQDVQSLHEQTLIEIKDALAAQGYFKPVIRSELKQLPTGWQTSYFIEPGKLLHIDSLDVNITGEGLCDPPFQQLLENFPLKKGQVLISKRYHEAKSQLVDLAVQRGYFSAKVIKSNILIDLQKYQAKVIIHFDTGPRYYFGAVHFLPSPFSTRFLQRFVPFCSQRPYQNCEVLKLQENLSSSSFFQQVTVTPKPEFAQNLQVPIEVAVVPRKALQYNLGAGYGTDTGLRGLADIHYRRLNRWGHSVSALVQASEKLNHGEASYIIPGPNPVTDYYKLSVAGETQNLPTSGKSRNEKLEASYISVRHHWLQTLSLGLRDEHSSPTDGRPIVNSTMLLPNLNWSKVRSDDPLSPNHGYQLNINFRGATKKLISNTDFIQALIQAKFLTTLHENTRVILKGQLGYTLISDVDQLPISLQFYTGGAQTVRGYRYQEIGPGRTLLLGSLELQQRIKGNFYGAVFFDAGNVSNGLTNNLKKSVGVGILWRSPIGVIEMTLAEALDQPGHPKLLQFSMGPEL